MRKVISIATEPHFSDYAELPEIEDVCMAKDFRELQREPLPDYKAANRKTRRDYIEDGFWILVAILVCYVVSRVRS